MPLSDLLLNLAGKAENIELRTAVQARMAIEGGLVGLFGGEIIAALTSGGKVGLLHDTGQLSGDLLELLRKAEIPIGGEIFNELLANPLGINTGMFEQDAGRAGTAIKKMLGFGAELTLSSGLLTAALEPLLGSHALRGLVESVQRIPEQLGLPFALGTIAANVFDTATGTPLREAIAYQTRPNRLEYREVSRLLKSHHLTPEQATEYLKRAGYQDIDIPRLIQLEQSFLGISDLEQAFIHGRMSEADIDDYLDTEGFSEVDISRLKQQWAENAQAEGVSLLKDVFRRGFLEYRVSEAQYRETLTHMSVPDAAIDLDVAALTLEREWGRLQESLGDIKALFQKGELADTAAVQRIIQIGYTSNSAQDFINLWVDESKKASRNIGQQKILTYLQAGVLTKERALELLIAQNLSVQYASLLVEHPGPMGSPYPLPLDEATYIAAFRDDVIDVEQLRAGLVALHTEPQRIDLTVRTEIAKKNRQAKPKKPPKALTEAQILDAVKYGTAGPTWAIRELETEGYTEADAQLIIATELAHLNGAVPTGWTVLH